MKKAKVKAGNCFDLCFINFSQKRITMEINTINANCLYIPQETQIGFVSSPASA